jgi:hypothetical protein
MCEFKETNPGAINDMFRDLYKSQIFSWTTSFKVKLFAFKSLRIINKMAKKNA